MNQLSYQPFKREVLFRMKERLGPEKPLKIQRVLKNNNVSLDAIVLDMEAMEEMMKETGHILSPTFYMDDLYDAYLDGGEIEIMVEMLCPYYEREYNVDFINMELFDSFENVRDRIAFKLVNKKMNRELLKEIPHIPFLDLEIVFYCVMEDAEGGIANVTIGNDLMKEWMVTESELYQVAVQNTKRIFGVVIQNIQEVIVDMILDSKHFITPPIDEELRQELIHDLTDEVMRFPVYVLSNHSRLHGAVCMLYRDLENFAEDLEDDLFIIPSSVHEVLLIPASQHVPEYELRNMLHEVNRDELDEVDYLSDQLYCYKRSTKRISMVKV